MSRQGQPNMIVYTAKVKKNLRHIRNIMLGCGVVDQMISYEGKEIYAITSEQYGKLCYRQTDITGRDPGWYWDGKCFEYISGLQDEDNQI